MRPDQLALFSSAIAVGGILLGAVVTGLYNLRSKRNEYANEYYKTVIQRRITAYEQLESLIVYFKASVVGTDNQAYHLPFSGENAKEELFKRFFSVMSQDLWLSDDAFLKTRDLNYLLFSMPETNAIEFGKQHYQAIAQIRESLEKILAADMMELHKVGRFLARKKKTRQSGFHAIQLYPKRTDQPS